MRYLTIPQTELEASVICLGTGGFGTNIPQDRAWELLDAFVEQGGNFVDTARVYGAWVPGGEGLSERTLAAWIKVRGGRAKLVLATKGGHPDLATMHVSRLSPAEITADLLGSLEALGTDYIDLYWLHRDDPAVPVGEILGVLNEHLAAGRIRAIGASNWVPERLAEAAGYARAHGLTGFCASQVGWSLAAANPGAIPVPGMLYMDAQAMTYHIRTGLPVVAYSSQAQGFFSGKYALRSGEQQKPPSETLARLYFSDENFGRLERVRALAARYGRSANEIALGYLLSQPFPVYPIVGCRTVEQVRASCAAWDVRLSAEEVAFLECSRISCTVSSLPSRRNGPHAAPSAVGISRNDSPRSSAGRPSPDAAPLPAGTPARPGNLFRCRREKVGWR
jgi:aryl-alcohol dehydrogenase-like predicted oxidoreductase